MLACSGARLEQARSLTDLGAALRRTNRRALARARGRGGAAAGWTHSPRASYASPAWPPDGMGNRAIAQALFVTVKTVEVHLGSTYRKLALQRIR